MIAVNASSDTEVIHKWQDVTILLQFRLFYKHIISSNVLQAFESNNLQCMPGENANLKAWKKNVTNYNIC